MMKATNHYQKYGLCLALLAQLVLVLPFLHQPFHMDDPIYLDIGRNVLKNPWEPHDFPYNFTGYRVPDMASHTHPPFVGYWIGLWMLLGNHSDPAPWSMHLVFLPFALLFAGSMYFLARRFSSNPLMTALLAISSPTAVVLSHTLMSDYPTLAFWTAGITFFIYGVDLERKSYLFYAAISLCCAAFCSYPALLASTLCWLYAAFHRCRFRWIWWIPGSPFLFMGAWLLKSSLYFGRFVLFWTMQYTAKEIGSFWSIAASKAALFPVLVSGSLLLAIPLIYQVSLLWRGRIAMLAALLSIAVTSLCVNQYSLTETALWGILFWMGLQTLFGFCWLLWDASWRDKEPSEPRLPEAGQTADTWSCRPEETWFDRMTVQQKDRWFLSLWFWSVALVAIGLYTSASCRYFLPLLPPLALLTAIFFNCYPQKQKKFWIGATLALSFFSAVAYSASDYYTAVMYQHMGQQWKQVFTGWERYVRFSGEWGFRHAMERNGYRSFIAVSDDLRGGDFVLLCEQAAPGDLPQDAASIAIGLGSKQYSTSFPLLLMSRQAHAGFYSSGWGRLPFGFYRGPLEKIHVRQISLMAETLPESSVHCSSGRPAVPMPALKGSGIDLRTEGDCTISFPLNAAPISRILLDILPEDQNKKAPGGVHFKLKGGSPTTELAVARDAVGRWVVNLPKTLEGDRIELDWIWPEEKGTGILRFHNLVRLPWDFPWEELAHDP